jgi:hypothetical protein
MERQTARIVRRAPFGTMSPNPYPYGAEVVEGQYEGITFCLAEKPTQPEGCYVVVEFYPEDQFARIVA